MNNALSMARPLLGQLDDSDIMKVWRLGLGRNDVIGLWLGEGDLPTPAFIGEAAMRAFEAGKTYYTHKRGIPELRQAIASYQDGFYGSGTEVERVSLTSSGMHGIVLIAQALLTPGDKVALLTPSWPNALAAFRIAGAEALEWPLTPKPEGGFALDLPALLARLEDLAIKALFFASPGNPTGWVMSAEEQRALLDFARERGLWIVADEVYGRFHFTVPEGEERPAPSFLSIVQPEDPVIVVNSFSKAWAMTGWRLGWLTAPSSLGPALDKLIEFSSSGAPNFLQYGALAAIEEGEGVAEEMIARTRRGGALVYEALADLPNVALAPPEAGFYAFIRVAGLSDSLAYAQRLVEETGVGLAPGSAFGAGGEGHLRLCFACSAARLEKAMGKLRPALARFNA